MTTEEFLKVKYVLVCAFVSAVKTASPCGLSVEELIHGIGIINDRIGFRGCNKIRTRRIAEAMKEQQKIHENEHNGCLCS